MIRASGEGMRSRVSERAHVSAAYAIDPTAVERDIQNQGGAKSELNLRQDDHAAPAPEGRLSLAETRAPRARFAAARRDAGNTEVLRAALGQLRRVKADGEGLRALIEQHPGVLAAMDATRASSSGTGCRRRRGGGSRSSCGSSSGCGARNARSIRPARRISPTSRWV